ncbi:MAG TPA: DUF4124 domain-containing protein [Gammaproteobacteria bacterium]|nr:DUF4124 domain-containing protein [Gammaproteobacteria bacterium]
MICQVRQGLAWTFVIQLIFLGSKTTGYNVVKHQLLKTRTLVTVVFLLFPLLAVSGIYRWVDADGQLHFSDQKPNVPSVEEITVENPNVIASPRGKSGPGSRQGSAGAAAAPLRYKTLAIVSPGDDEAIRANNGQVSISCTLEPALGTKAGHQINIVIDGRRITGLTSCGTTVNQLSRGTHTVYVEVVDTMGKTLITSATHRFHVLRTSRL